MLLESIDTEKRKHAENSENTRAAIEELNEVLRFLFPIVPHKSHLIWSARHHGILINQPRDLLNSYTMIEHNNMESLRANKDDQTNDYPNVDQLEDIQSDTEPSSNQIESALNHHRRASDEQEQNPLAITDHRGHPSMYQERLPTQHETPLNAMQTNERDDNRSFRINHESRVNTNADINRNQIRNQLSFLFSKFKSKSFQTKPESTTPTLGKRGPECMKKCITQGLLHPVQCHSLC